MKEARFGHFPQETPGEKARREFEAEREINAARFEAKNPDAAAKIRELKEKSAAENSDVKITSLGSGTSGMRELGSEIGDEIEEELKKEKEAEERAA